MIRTISIFRNNRNQTIRLPKELEFQGATKLTIERQGNTILLRPVRLDWLSLMEKASADADFLGERPDLCGVSENDWLLFAEITHPKGKHEFHRSMGEGAAFA